MKVSIIDWIIKKLKRCIAIVEEGNTASQAIGSGKYVMWKGNLYTADTAISSGTTLAASGGSKNLTAVADGGYNDLNGKISTLNSNKPNFTKGTFTPKLYDYETYLRDMPTSEYIKIDKLVVASISCQNFDFSGINTMLQVRNLPMDTVLGGTFYMGAITGEGGTRTIQATGVGGYIRPNLKSSDISNPTSVGVATFLFIGWKS